jgi:hypothetical protein
MATMEEALVPLYLHHRYQAEATTKVVAGQYYTYAIRGDGQEPLTPVPADQQWAALRALGRTLDAAELALPRSILETLPPRPFRFDPHQELFPRNTGLVFDALSPAMVASDITLQFLFNPERAARMVQQKALDPSLPGLAEVISFVADATMGADPEAGYQAEVNRVVERVFMDHLMALAAHSPLSQVRAITTAKLEEYGHHMADLASQENEEEAAHLSMLSRDIQRFLDRPMAPMAYPEALSAPPGSPIGDPGMVWLDWQSWRNSRTGWVDFDRWWWE